VKTRHRSVEHVGEVELELEAADEAGIFEAALAAFAELVAADAAGEPARHEIELAAGDRALLLVDWLSELVFLAEVEEFVPERVAAFELAGNGVRATVAGRRDRPRHLVKAVTLNDLEFEQHEGAWHGRVVLDV
jgi:SHS2 domain-containing protein